MYRKASGILILFVFLFIAGACYAARADAAGEGTSEWVTFPYTASKAESYEYLYVVGGYHSVDNGCPAFVLARIGSTAFK